jgi:hypothetical protein
MDSAAHAALNTLSLHLRPFGGWDNSTETKAVYTKWKQRVFNKIALKGWGSVNSDEEFFAEGRYASETELIPDIRPPAVLMAPAVGDLPPQPQALSVDQHIAYETLNDDRLKYDKNARKEWLFRKHRGDDMLNGASAEFISELEQDSPAAVLVNSALTYPTASQHPYDKYRRLWDTLDDRWILEASVATEHDLLEQLRLCTDRFQSIFARNAAWNVLVGRIKAIAGHFTNEEQLKQLYIDGVTNQFLKHTLASERAKKGREVSGTWERHRMCQI